MSLIEAFKHVKSCRAIINPNHGFMKQLESYEGILTARYIISIPICVFIPILSFLCFHSHTFVPSIPV